MLAMAYGNVYVAQIAMGANDTQTVKAFIEAERYDGPSIIIAYSHCIAHGYNMKDGMTHQKLAVDSGIWQMYRYNPDAEKEGKNPLRLDYKEPKIPVSDYMNTETRFNMVNKMNPEAAKEFIAHAQEQADKRWEKYSHLAELGEKEK